MLRIAKRLNRIWCWFLGLFLKDRWRFCQMCKGIGFLPAGREIRWKTHPLPGDNPAYSSFAKKGSLYPPGSSVYDAENDHEGGRGAVHYVSRPSHNGETCPECCGLRKTYRVYRHNELRRTRILFRNSLTSSLSRLWKGEFPSRRQYKQARKIIESEPSLQYNEGSKRSQHPMLHRPGAMEESRAEGVFWRNEGE